jgi:hypothetical protein
MPKTNAATKAPTSVEIRGVVSCILGTITQLRPKPLWPTQRTRHVFVTMRPSRGGTMHDVK